MLSVKRKYNQTACRIASGGNLCRLNEIGRIVVPWIGPILGRNQRHSSVSLPAPLAALKVTSGLSNANAHVLEAAWALRTGDRVRAEASLALAEARLAANPIAVSTANNRTNITALRQQLNAGSR